MTLGEKLKKARKQAGLSQEQLSEKLGVSRSAVAKWEADNGIPDVYNLKAISGLLNVTVDYLLDDGEVMDELVLREPHDLTELGKGSKSAKKDRAVRDKFPNAKIYPIQGEMKLSKSEKVIDNALGFLTDAPFGIPELINALKNTDKQFYLVEKEGKQFLVTVTDEFIETRQMAKQITENRFEIGNWKFRKCAYEVK